MHAKKIFLILLCLAITLPAFAKKNDTSFGSQYEDTSMAVRVGVGFVTGYTFPVTFAGVSGLSYFFNPNMSAFLEYNYLGSSSGSLGIQFHF